METCTDSYRLIGRIPLLPRVEIFVGLTEKFGLYQLDVRVWNEGVDGNFHPTSNGFNLSHSQLYTFARLVAEAERLSIEDGEWADPEEEVERGDFAG